MSKIFDISVPIKKKMPIWPGSLAPEVTPIKHFDFGDCVHDSSLKMGLHTGTHIDAPSHFIQGAQCVNNIPLEEFICEVYVLEMLDCKEITSLDLSNAKIPSNIKRILFKTSNSQLWSDDIMEFKEDFVALTVDAAKWLANRKFRLVGIDYLSVQKYTDVTPETHVVLLESKVILLEGLDLSKISEGKYELICFPLKLEDCEASPVRAVLRRAE